MVHAAVSASQSPRRYPRPALVAGVVRRQVASRPPRPRRPDDPGDDQIGLKAATSPSGRIAESNWFDRPAQAHAQAD